MICFGTFTNLVEIHDLTLQSRKFVLPSHLEPISIVFVYKQKIIITCTEIGYVRTFNVDDGR